MTFLHGSAWFLIPCAAVAASIAYPNRWFVIGAVAVALRVTWREIVRAAR